jgi:hypothetical protein
VADRKLAKPKPTATHETITNADGSQDHRISLGVRVVLTQKPDCWMAQSIEFDYFSYGSDMKGAIHSFAKGLARSIYETLKMSRSPRGLFMRAAPDKVRAEFSDAINGRLELNFVAEVHLTGAFRRERSCPSRSRTTKSRRTGRSRP